MAYSKRITPAEVAHLFDPTDLPQSGQEYTVKVGTFVEELQKTIRSMEWVEDTDAAAVRLAFHYAAMLDAAEATKDFAVIVKSMNYGAHLKNLLNDLGATPVARGAVSQEQKVEDPMEERLKDFRSKADRARKSEFV